MAKAKLAEGKPFKCGIMLNLAAFKLESFQALGITFLTEAAAFIKHDLVHGTDEQKAEAAKASEALLRSLATAMGDK